MKFSAVFAAIALITPVVLATHDIGAPCTKTKYYNTLGCSTDACNIVICTDTDDGWYWEQYASCGTTSSCNNGACNGGAKSACA